MRTLARRRLAALPLTLLAFACTDDPEAGVEPDAAVAVPDAAVVPPDAIVVLPDAAVVLPDAALVLPDAAVVLPDAAAVLAPDAAVVLAPDAAAVLAPDAAPPPPGECVADVLVRPAALPPEAPGDPGCPPGMARTTIPAASLCMDRYEAALVEITDAGEVPWSPYHHPGNRRVRAVSVAGVVPQGYIDQVTAGAACAESGKRLCTNEEWVAACRGVDDTLYPYGDVRQPGACNDARAQHPAVELFPNDPNPFSHLQDACINQLPASLDATGANASCVTPAGLFDLMGNLHEWTSDPAGTFRGGFYVDTAINGNGCEYRTTAHDTAYWDYSTGFRCCALAR